MVLLVDVAYPPEELSAYIPRGRKLNLLEARLIARSATWEFAGNGLGDRTFLELKGDKNFDHVEEINLSENEISTLAFIKSKSLQVLNLKGNRLKKIVLNKNIFPRLIKLDLTANEIAVIEQLEHPFLETL